MENTFRIMQAQADPALMDISLEELAERYNKEHDDRYYATIFVRLEKNNLEDLF